mmetsp:Transcript_107991/g.344786  ORF Transcript_107991/g.344786 Transcript_107991/m.344786 type:complete len:401 (+) Transcript_107991:55-1257(+)
MVRLGAVSFATRHVGMAMLWHGVFVGVYGNLRRGAPGANESNGSYSLDWEASGESFFDGFDFLAEDPNHGAADFVSSYADAQLAGVARISGSHAILRTGRRSTKAFKRMSARIRTKKSWKHFLAAVHFKHLPWGCGVWPSFFTLGVGEWPAAGEMDILEYVNDGKAMTSFHTSKECRLDEAKVNKYGSMPDANYKGNDNSNYNCLTKYCATCKSLGCAPNTMPLLTCQQMADRPGVFAMERTASFTKIFFIPSWAIPADLDAGRPTPEAWDQWIISYYPFGDSESTCPEPDDIMSKQRFVLQILLCGDWASKVWGDSAVCSRMGPSFDETATRDKSFINSTSKPRRCRAVDPLAENAPEQDCCHQFITDADGDYRTDQYLNERAFFKIDWFKVFTRGGET